MGAMLITGLVVSSVPVLAFAEQGKEATAAEASEIQEKDIQTDSGTMNENGSETELKTDTISEEEEKEIVTENPEEKENDAEADTEKDEAIDTETGNDADKEPGSEPETGTEIEPGSEMDSDTEGKSETEDEVPDEENNASQDGEAEKPENVDLEKSSEELQKEELSEKKTEEPKTEQVETEIQPEDLPEKIPEELLPKTELATPSNVLMLKEKSMGEQLLGIWAADDYTSLRFAEDGQGSMILPESEYEFQYALEDDKLILDFASSRAKDAEYTVDLTEDSMKLTAGEEEMVQEIILQRTE